MRVALLLAALGAVGCHRRKPAGGFGSADAVAGGAVGACDHRALDRAAHRGVLPPYGDHVDAALVAWGVAARGKRGGVEVEDRLGYGRLAFGLDDVDLDVGMDPGTGVGLGWLWPCGDRGMGVDVGTGMGMDWAWTGHGHGAGLWGWRAAPV